MDLEALGWGALAASSLAIGALLGVARRWRRVVMGCVLGFGAGALIASVSFELARKDLKAAGWSRRSVILLWAGVAAICTLATLGGARLADVAHPPLEGSINGFAAGALLVMLANEMIPEAQTKGGKWAGPATVLGFAVAAGFSHLTS
jgi:zinc transporter, ZIP family